MEGTIRKGCGNKVFDYSTTIELTPSSDTVLVDMEAAEEDTPSLVVDEGREKEEEEITYPEVTAM